MSLLLRYPCCCELGNTQPATIANNEILVPLELAEGEATPKAVRVDCVILFGLLLFLFLALLLITLWGPCDKDKSFLRCQLVVGRIDGMVANSNLHLAGASQHCKSQGIEDH